MANNLTFINADTKDKTMQTLSYSIGPNFDEYQTVYNANELIGTAAFYISKAIFGHKYSLYFWGDVFPYITGEKSVEKFKNKEKTPIFLSLTEQNRDMHIVNFSTVGKLNYELLCVFIAQCIMVTAKTCNINVDELLTDCINSCLLCEVSNTPPFNKINTNGKQHIDTVSNVTMNLPVPYLADFKFGEVKDGQNNDEQEDDCLGNADDDEYDEYTKNDG